MNMDALNRAVHDALTDKEGNYIMPFLWMHEGDGVDLPARIAKVQESGCRAFCVESRPYPDFCGPLWWRDMRTVLEEARRRGMKVWILDDKHFPTGYANGLVERKYPNRRRCFLRERHVDVMGPAQEMAFLVPPCKEGEQLLTVCAYRRSQEGENLEGSPAALFFEADHPFVYWDVPSGCWRIFFIYQTHHGNDPDHNWYIDMLSEEGPNTLIEAVYEPHYQHFSDYFGDTLVGFFSDEPSLDCQHIGPRGEDAGFYYRTVGQPGVALPWNGEIIEIMRNAGIEAPLAALPGLWYQMADESPLIRCAYMDAVTQLWRRNFSWQIGKWCRDRKVQYIGHIIEDQNAHARLGCSAGHYFRALDGQDMSGIDIVLHQVVPGMADYRISSNLFGDDADSPFYHYVLAQMSASQAKLTPHMHGRAMCEVFGAYGWAEGTPLMKWMIDFLLVRGINHFVPHGFSDIYPDPDCPPHFYANGNNPQFQGFSRLMQYTNKAAHMLSGGDRQAAGLLLYTAEAEWMNGAQAMLMQAPAKALYDHQIGYDIASLDILAQATIEAGKFIVHGHTYAFLIVPQAEYLPEAFWRVERRAAEQAAPVIFVDKAPDYCETAAGVEVPLGQLAEYILAQGWAHDYRADNAHIRIGHFRAQDSHCFMLFNESVTEKVETTLRLPVDGDCCQIDLLGGGSHRSCAEDGRMRVALEPYQSTILFFFGGEYPADLPSSWQSTMANRPHLEPELTWAIDLMELGIHDAYRPFLKDAQLMNITGRQGEPFFSGYMRYRTVLRWTDRVILPMALDLGRVGMTARLILNGRDLGIRICPPYRWTIGEALLEGDNQVEVIVANTLVHRLRDPFSEYLPIPPSGLLGPVRILM